MDGGVLGHGCTQIVSFFLQTYTGPCRFSKVYTIYYISINGHPLTDEVLREKFTVYCYLYNVPINCCLTVWVQKRMEKNTHTHAGI